MSIDAGTETEGEAQDTRARASLATAAARNLATTTKTVPQMQDITSRWLLRMLPWVQVSGGTYRVNRRLSYRVGDGRVQFVQTGSDVRVIPAELGELAPLRGFEDEEVLGALADRFVKREFAAGETLVEAGAPNDRVFLVVHGKIDKQGEGRYGDRTSLGLLGDGDHFGEQALVDDGAAWEYTAQAATSVIVLEMPRDAFERVAGGSDALRAHLAAFAAGSSRPQNAKGEAEIPMSAGHHGEALLPSSFVDYELNPREYELSAAQTVMRVHSRVADLYNQPMDQIEQQLRLTIEALRERQEHELINNPEFGLLANADYEQRIQAHSGPPTPDDMDELLSRRRGSRLFLAHPRTIAAFGRECSRLGLYPDVADVQGHAVPSWRGVPILPCNKIPISESRTSSILVLRTGEDDQGVVGLHQTGLPDEYQPGLSVRFMGINEQALISYLVTAYYSAAVLVPDALGVLENVEISRAR
ncbi:family 2B encapsulin nanocompartment shell protein [Streptomyces sp. SID3343]|uniref:family 2B encapsulin nanocompartment shell protein n=1 Tax=Streptomyces sp. SID3343 TaxID=2690260 RepID=UPI002351984A|nr:family 2B encapsulin nanocompartment shell protein [Streptomyces sp. SID3343]